MKKYTVITLYFCKSGEAFGVKLTTLEHKAPKIINNVTKTITFNPLTFEIMDISYTGVAKSDVYDVTKNNFSFTYNGNTYLLDKVTTDYSFSQENLDYFFRVRV